MISIGQYKQPKFQGCRIVAEHHDAMTGRFLNYPGVTIYRFQITPELPEGVSYANKIKPCDTADRMAQVKPTTLWNRLWKKPLLEKALFQRITVQSALPSNEKAKLLQSIGDTYRLGEQACKHIYERGELPVGDFPKNAMGKPIIEFSYEVFDSLRKGNLFRMERNPNWDSVR